MDEQNQNKPGGLNRLNWLNVASFVLNIGVTYGINNLGWFGTKTNSELSKQYQTLVTPKAAAFSIWGIIFLVQAIFIVVQALPKFRADPLVQKGVGYFYAWTCLFQAVWSLAFGLEVFWLSVVFMLGIWASLLVIVYRQYYIPASLETNQYLEFWLLRFPFAIHCGWITAASALNVNVLVVDQGASAVLQLSFAIVSLAILHAISVWVVFAVETPNITIASVLCWAAYWINAELQDPNALIVATFDASVIQGVSYAAGTVAAIILAQLHVRIFAKFVALWWINDDEAGVDQDDDEGVDETPLLMA